MHDIYPRHTSTTCIIDGWTNKLPTWAGKDRNRGLSSWGDHVKRDKHTKQPVHKRRWEVTGICRTAILSAIDFFASTWGLMPVKTGHLPPEGHKFKSTQRCGFGLNKKQLRLVLDDPDDLIDIWSTFQFVVWTLYCFNLDPPVETGTEGHIAVFKVLTGDECNKRLLLSMKTKLQVRTW